MTYSLILYPSGRPDEVEPAITRALSTTRHLLEFFVGISSDHEFPELPNLRQYDNLRNITVVHYGRLGDHSLVEIVNNLYRRAQELVSLQPDTLVGYWSDDFYPRRDWMQELHWASVQYPEKMFFQANDVHKLTPHPGATVPFVRHRWYLDANHGYIFNPAYRRFGCDCENFYLAQKQGVFMYVDAAVVEHRHWALGQRPMDELDIVGLNGYAWGRAPDWATLQRRIC